LVGYDPIMKALTDLFLNTCPSGISSGTMLSMSSGTPYRNDGFTVNVAATPDPDVHVFADTAFER